MSDLALKPPVSVLNKDLNISLKEAFKGLSRVAIGYATGDPTATAQGTAEVASAISVKQNPGEVAWLLIYKALHATVLALLEEYRSFLTLPVGSTLDLHCEEIEAALNSSVFKIEYSFFDSPGNLDLFSSFNPAFRTWLIAIGMQPQAADSVVIRLNDTFAVFLHEEWLKNSSKYAILESSLQTPFASSTATTRAWQKYKIALVDKVNERMFDEAFSLKQIYVPLRAFHATKTLAGTSRALDPGTSPPQTPDEKPISPMSALLPAQTDEREDDEELALTVVDLSAELHSWIRNFSDGLAVRMISGGPGSGKSSFTKIFARSVVEEHPEVTVLHVPLHQFNIKGDLLASLEDFIKQDRLIPENPLGAKERVLLIFDGLDELSMHNSASQEAAQLFIDEIIQKIDRFNSQKYKYQALITGREVSVHLVATRMRAEGQILHLLPYHISSTASYSDPNDLLKLDQRILWWEKYSELKGLSISGMPEELLLNDELDPITAEPLLNYLVALSYQRKEVSFSNATINTIYEDLLKAVYDRQWDYGKHKSVNNLEYKEFSRILEEVALAVWHGDGRTASAKQIFERCAEGHLQRYISSFQQDSAKGVTRLLTAFYFREGGTNTVGDSTFEFTHKSFGEYLAACRIKRAAIQLHEEMLRNAENPDSGIDIKEALRRWFKICGPTALDHYVAPFLVNEISSVIGTYKRLQEIFATLLSFCIRQGLPIEGVNISRYNDLDRQVRNAEVALLTVHHSCALTSKQTSDIKLLGAEHELQLKIWIARILRGPLYAEGGTIARDIFSGLTLSNMELGAFDFSHVTFRNVNLTSTGLIRATFSRSRMHDCTFKDSTLTMAKFDQARIFGSAFSNCKIADANFSGSSLAFSQISDARAIGALFLRARVRSVTFTGCDLSDCDFSFAHFENVRFLRCKLDFLRFYGTRLDRTTFQDCTSRYIDFRESNIVGAPEGIQLIEADYDGQDLIIESRARRTPYAAFRRARPRTPRSTAS